MRKALLIFFVLAGLTSFANTGGGKEKMLKKVAGTVVDQELDELAGARIEIVELDKVIYTDFEGEFTLEDLRTGAYTLKISHISFESTSEQLYVVNLRDASHLDIQLKSK